MASCQADSAGTAHPAAAGDSLGRAEPLPVMGWAALELPEVHGHRVTLLLFLPALGLLAGHGHHVTLLLLLSAPGLPAGHGVVV